jgi:hypothetical protein
VNFWIYFINVYTLSICFFIHNHVLDYGGSIVKHSLCIRFIV